jgi:flagellar motor switch protein FliM
MRDKNLEQQIIINFCVKIGKRASEMSALLTMAHIKYTMKKLSVFMGQRQFKEGQETAR